MKAKALWTCSADPPEPKTSDHASPIVLLPVSWVLNVVCGNMCEWESEITDQRSGGEQGIARSRAYKLTSLRFCDLHSCSTSSSSSTSFRVRSCTQTTQTHTADAPAASAEPASNVTCAIEACALVHRLHVCSVLREGRTHVHKVEMNIAEMAIK